MDTFATINGRTALHIVPAGNCHARCGRIVTTVVSGPALAVSVAAGTHTVCKTCVKVKAPRDLTVIQEEPTNTWIVTDGFDNEIGRVEAETDREAVSKAARIVDGDFAVRRLREVPPAQEGRTWDVLLSETGRVLTRVFADDRWSALDAAEKALPYTNMADIVLYAV